MVNETDHSTSVTQPEVAEVAPARRADALIVGGGISGLSLAAWLRQSGCDVALFERRPAAGGVIRSRVSGEFLFECGPNTVLDKHPSFDELIAWADLENATLRAPLRESKRHIWLNGELHEAPDHPLRFLRSPLLGWRSKAALLREWRIPPVAEDESVANFVARRLGREWVDHLITPMVSGVWAGNPAALSISHAFPIMKQMELDGGSILRGAMRLKRKRRREGTARQRNMVSFDEGLERLPRKLALKLGTAYHGGSEVLGVIPPAQAGGDWEVQVRKGGRIERWLAPQVALACEALTAAALVRPWHEELATTLLEVPYTRLNIASLGIKRSNIAALPEGFGFLVPRGEGLTILGTIINSNSFAGRAPDDSVQLTVFIGGELEPDSSDLSDEETFALLRRDLGRAIGWNGRRESSHIERWSAAIPQYDMAQGEREACFAKAEAEWEGLHLAGNWSNGVAMAERIEVARLITKTMMQKINTKTGAK